MGKSRKKAGRKQNPEARGAVAGGNPNAFFNEKPAWKFCMADKEQWSPLLQTQGMGEKVIPTLFNYEGMMWKEILANKKINHPIDVQSLNQCAIKRLEELSIEAESLYSLHIQGGQRLYGLVEGDGTFQLIWYDMEHGDTDTCVCRSRKKGT